MVLEERVRKNNLQIMPNAYLQPIYVPAYTQLLTNFVYSSEGKAPE